MLTIGVVASVIGVAITLAMDWFPRRAAPAADRIDTLYDVLLIASVPIFILVMTIAIYSVVRFRARPGDMSDGAPLHGDTRLEIIWVTIPALLVTGLAIYGWVVLDDIEAKKPNELRVNVLGQQFAWSFEYPGEGRVRSNELVLPVDRPVDFRIRTNDVIHSFWVPQFRLKIDAVPGLRTQIRVTPDREGRFDVVCAELCGVGHSTMRQSVRVVSAARFRSWVDERRRAAGGGGGTGGGGAAGEAGPGGGGAAADGKRVFSDAGCASCHTLSDAGARATVGPNLDRLSSSARRSGSREGQSPEEYVRTSILEPDAFTAPGFPNGVMPSDYRDRLSDAQLDALVEYLLDVGRGGKGS